jgi:predicted kinase
VRCANADGGVQKMKLTLPELSLVVLVGASSSGKSTFARKHFKPTEVISADKCRAMVADDENAMDVNKEGSPAVSVGHLRAP